MELQPTQSGPARGSSERPCRDFRDAVDAEGAADIAYFDALHAEKSLRSKFAVTSCARASSGCVRFTDRHRFSLLMLAVALGVGALLGVLVSKRQIDAIRCVAK
jgi:hypothetical protein